MNIIIQQPRLAKGISRTVFGGKHKKAILTILAVLTFAADAQAQTVVLDYDMSKTPDQQGFELNVSCGTVWNATGTMLEFRGCRPGGPAFPGCPPANRARPGRRENPPLPGGSSAPRPRREG